VQPSNSLVLAILVVGAGGGALIDLRTRRIPNVLTASLLTAGVFLAASGLSGLTVKAALLGMCLGLALMMPGYLIGATGAGDVKLFAAVGALMGSERTLTAFLYTALAGGAIAILVAVRRKRLSQTIDSVRSLATGAANITEIEGVARNNRFAYAPAIAVGVVLAALRG